MPTTGFWSCVVVLSVTLGGLILSSSSSSWLLWSSSTSSTHISPLFAFVLISVLSFGLYSLVDVGFDQLLFHSRQDTGDWCCCAVDECVGCIRLAAASVVVVASASAVVVVVVVVVAAEVDVEEEAVLAVLAVACPAGAVVVMRVVASSRAGTSSFVGIRIMPSEEAVAAAPTTELLPMMPIVAMMRARRANETL